MKKLLLLGTAVVVLGLAFGPLRAQIGGLVIHRQPRPQL